MANNYFIQSGQINTEGWNTVGATTTSYHYTYASKPWKSQDPFQSLDNEDDKPRPVHKLKNVHPAMMHPPGAYLYLHPVSSLPTDYWIACLSCVSPIPLLFDSDLERAKWYSQHYADTQHKVSGVRLWKGPKKPIPLKAATVTFNIDPSTDAYKTLATMLIDDYTVASTDYKW